MFKKSDSKKVFDTNLLENSLTNADEVNIDFKKGSGTKDTYGTLSGANNPISVAVPKPLSSNMDSRSFLPTKTPSFS